LTRESRIGWSVTTLTKIDKIQKLERTASFWMSGMRADVEREDREPVGE
jgi:hypothetical protein